MTLAEAVAAFVALRTEDKRPPGEVFGKAGGRDMAFCATGLPYERITSSGVETAGRAPAALFTDDDLAIDSWLDAANRACPAGSVIFWRHRPRLVEISVVAVDQQAALNDISLHSCAALRLVFVDSEFASEQPKEEKG